MKSLPLQADASLYMWLASLGGLVALLSGSAGEAGSSGTGSCATALGGAGMILCDGSCVVRGSCAAVPSTGPRTIAGCAQLGPPGAFAGCATGSCSPAIAVCPPAVVAHVVSAVPIARVALVEEMFRRYAGRMRLVAVQTNCTVILRGVPGELADYSSGSALRFSLERGVVAPVGLTETAVVELTVAAGRRRQLRQLQTGTASTLQVVATVVGPTDYDLSELADSSYPVEMAAAVAATVQQLASGQLVVVGVDCGATACVPAVSLANEIQVVAASTGDALTTVAEFVHRFDITDMMARGGAGAPQASAAEFTPQVIQDIVATASGANRAEFLVTVDSGLNPSPVPPPGLPPTPPEHEVKDEDNWFVGPVSLIFAGSVGSLLCLGCGGVFCCILCRRSAPVGGMKDIPTGVGMAKARARARAEQDRKRAAAELSNGGSGHQLGQP